jgi:hypothetical protein
MSKKINTLACYELFLTENDVAEATDIETLKTWLMEVEKLRIRLDRDIKIEIFQNGNGALWVQRAKFKKKALGLFIKRIQMRLNTLNTLNTLHKQTVIADQDRIKERLFIDLCRVTMDKDKFLSLWAMVDTMSKTGNNSIT